MRIGTVCSGIGSPEVAVRKHKHNIAFACEIDKYARASYTAIHGEVPMFTDMTSDEFHSNAGYCDLFIGGIPCQAFSLAGKRLGELDKRGLLFYDFYKYVQNNQPKVFIIENVKGLLSDAGGKTFQNWLLLLGNSVNGHTQMFGHPDSLGYNLHHTVLNSKDFGVPQNRERVFIVGIRSDLLNDFRFPKGWKLDKRLKDVLEVDVDEKYYLSEKMLRVLYNHGNKISKERTPDISACIHAGYYKMGGRDQQYIKNIDSICVAMRGRNPNNLSDRTTGLPTEQRLEPNSQGITNTITSVQKDNLIVESVVQLNTSKESGGKQPYQHNRVYSDYGLMATLDTDSGRKSVLTNSRIRRLTPLECWRLQGFSDKDFYKAKAVNSDSQLYKQAGNSITTNVMEAIIDRLIHLL